MGDASNTVPAAKSITEPARIFQSELRCGLLSHDIQESRDVLFCVNLPACLVVADRATAEVMAQIQYDVYNLPGLTPEFKALVGSRIVTHTKDKCASNEKQVSAARAIHDREGGVIQDCLWVATFTVRPLQPHEHTIW